MKKLCVFVMTLTLSLGALSSYAGLPFFAANQQTNSALVNVLQEVMPAVVNIHAEGDTHSDQDRFSEEHSDNSGSGGDDSGDGPAAGHFVSIGSGVIVDAKQGYILTNAHVIYQADNITVTLNDSRRYKAHVVGFDKGFDIAIIQIHASNLTAIPMGDSDKLRVGDIVTAIGSPFDLQQTVTSGIISGLHRSINIEGNEDFIQTDASINMGSSGGALVDMQGQLIGINTAILAPDGGNIGIGFSIPINLARSVMEEILKYGKIERGLLGILIQNLTPDLAESFNEPKATGVLVSQVNPGTPGADAGIKEGDIIQQVNGVAMTTSAQLRNTISLLRPGTTVDITLLRDGDIRSVKATLTSARELSNQQDEMANSPLGGVALANFDQIVPGFGLVIGVQVVDLDPNSDAWSAMLRPGDIITSVNGKRVTNLKTLQEAMGNSDKLLLHVLRSDGALYLTVP